MKIVFEDIVGGKLKKFKKDELDNNDELGFIVTKGNKEYFLGFTDPQEVYVKGLAEKEHPELPLLTWKEQREALQIAILRGDRFTECNCIPYEKWRLEEDKKITVSISYPAKPENFCEYPVVMVFNEKLKTWQAEPFIEYKDVCPVCLKLLLVRAIAGTTWLACCSKECYEKYEHAHTRSSKYTMKLKTCAICGKKHNNWRYTCSDECHELFKQKLIKEFGEHKVVVDLTTGKEHRVPTADIIEKGLKQEDLKNYPIVGINRLVMRAIEASELKRQKEKIEVSWINLDTGDIGAKDMTFDEYKKEIGF